MSELKDVRQHCNDWDGKILDISDIINTKVLPNIEKANRKAEGATNRLDAFWNVEATTSTSKVKSKEVLA